MLKSIKLHNFKTFLNAEVRFAQRHLLLGKNCAGKTNLVKSLQFLSLTASGDLNKAAECIPGGVEEICNWHVRNDALEICCECTLDYEDDAYEFTYELTVSRQTPKTVSAGMEPNLRVVNERLVVDGGDLKGAVLLDNNGNEAAMLHEEQAEDGDQRARREKVSAPPGATMLSRLYATDKNRRALLFRQFLQNWQYFSISPLAVRIGANVPAAPIEWPWSWLDPDGTELSNALFKLKNVDELRYRRVIGNVHHVEPRLQAILFVPVPDRAPVPFVDLEGQRRASWNGLSDGTLRALALAVIIELASAHSPPNYPVPSLAIIEEPENGIHPGLIRKFFDLFEDWAPGAQFIFTSHSPYFVDMFDNMRQSVTILRRATDRSEIRQPSPAAFPNDGNGDEPLTLSTEYALELFE